MRCVRPQPAPLYPAPLLSALTSLDIWHAILMLVSLAQFAATACTIVSGAIAERARVEAYVIYSFFMAAWVYPVVIHSIWSGAGWASMFRYCSFPICLRTAVCLKSGLLCWHHLICMQHVGSAPVQWQECWPLCCSGLYPDD